MSVIAAMMSRLFGATEFRALILGLDAAGKTSILYRLKLGEVVTTIPTIGFNVETVQHGSTSLTMWDVGGCDKIRPLWRHYFQNTQAMIFVVDAHDRDRLLLADGYDRYSSVQGLFNATIHEEELRETVVLIFVNKSDLPNAMTVDHIRETLQLSALRGRLVHVQSCCAISGDGLHEGLDWLCETLRRPHSRSDPAGEDYNIRAAVPAPATHTPPAVPVENKSGLLEEWLSRPDEDDDVFIAKLVDLTLDTWDHYTHLRIAYVLLARHGRSVALPLIFSYLRAFIEHSPYLNQNPSATNPKRSTFHETMTYFWVHMVHYSMETSSKQVEQTFKSFLLWHPELANGGLFLYYYTKQLMLMDPRARTEVVLPDVKPLPSIVPKTLLQASVPPSLPPPPIKLTDEQFYRRFQEGALPSWGHSVKLRLIYVLLVSVWGRRHGGTDHILDALAQVEGAEHSHMTINYFWIHLVSCAIMHAYQAKVKFGRADAGVFGKVLVDATAAGDEVFREDLESFESLFARPESASLQDPTLVDRFFSRSLLDAPGSFTAVSLPDLQPLPNPPLVVIK